MKRIGYILLVLLLLSGFVGVFVFINQDKLIDRFIARQSAAAQPRMDLLEKDGTIRLVTVGTGSPLPGERAMSCNAVFVNGHLFIFDVGDGASRALEQYRIPITQIEGIFITHWHDDHYMDLPEVINRSWLRGRSSPLTIYGPDPIDSVMNGVESFLHIDRKFRVAHHGTNVMDTTFMKPTVRRIDLQGQKSMVVYDKDRIEITVFAVDHQPVSPAYGYKITYEDKTLVISGDTKVSDNLIEQAQGADLLLHEALAFDFIQRAEVIQTEQNNSRNATILNDIRDYHSDPIGAATVANAASVKKLILTHLGPAPENPISRTFYTRGMSDIYPGPILLAEDGDLFEIEK